MTCTSLKSGMASSGVFVSAQMPPAMPKTTRMMMRKAFRELDSMMRSSRNDSGRDGESACRGVGDSPPLAGSPVPRFADAPSSFFRRLSDMVISPWFDEPLFRLLGHLYNLTEDFFVVLVYPGERLLVPVTTAHRNLSGDLCLCGFGF